MIQTGRSKSGEGGLEGLLNSYTSFCEQRDANLWSIRPYYHKTGDLNHDVYISLGQIYPLKYLLHDSWGRMGFVSSLQIEKAMR